MTAAKTQSSQPLSGLHFNGSQIGAPKPSHTAISPDCPGTDLVASLHTDAMHEARTYAATGRAMAASGEMLDALQAVAAKLGSRPYGTGSYLPKPIRDQVYAAIAKATGQQDATA